MAASVAVCLVLGLALARAAVTMTDEERLRLRHEAEDMFHHAYDAYMDNAWPADELMPLSCRGRYRGREASRGDIDDAMGNFSLTLIDSLDMLVVLGEGEEFEASVKKVIDTVNFDTDVVVSVFETNIRIVGGLVSGHVLAELVRAEHGAMAWYRGELLNMAVDCANRLLPAFNSSTGLPYPRVNLRTGLRGLDSLQVTCTACAGSMILEFAALSRLTGESVYEEKAGRAMDVLWAARHRQSNLVGNVLNVNTGDWIRRDSGVGAGIDSYYEYVAKAYVLLGEEQYLSRWQTHYASIMKYLGQRPVMQDVHMHRPHTTSKHFIDALGAFWPGLQVLTGDLKPAIESHEILYQIMQRHNFIPEAFTSDFQVHWGQHLLRPEFIESTYFLYRATLDPYYLQVGEKVLRSLQKHARVTCGYASIKDVRTMQKEDRMDSFVLAETFKYLYLLFSEDEDMIIDIDSFVFTTEGHLLPLSLARLSPETVLPLSKRQQEMAIDEDVESSQACPSMSYLFPGNNNYAKDIRSPLANFVPTRTKTSNLVRKLHASDFQSNNDDHLNLVKNMGINIISLPDGRVQLLHTLSNAKTPEDGEEGLLFMQEMIELSKQQTNLPATEAKAVRYKLIGGPEEDVLDVSKTIFAGPAQFGRELGKGFSVSGPLILAEPIEACRTPDNAKEFWGAIVIVRRGDCMFVEKARILEKAGAKGGIVIDNNKGSTSTNSPLFSMSGDGVDDVSIPMVFVFYNDAKDILEALKSRPKMEASLLDSSDTATKDQDLTESVVEELHHDITSPVRSFLEKSKQQVEKYWKSMLNDVDEDEEAAEEKQRHLESVFLRTVFNEEGQEDQDEEDEDDPAAALKAAAGSGGSGGAAAFSKLEDFLNPDNAAIKKLVEHRVLKNPAVLSELLDVKFSDLLKAFQNILAGVKASSVEAAYLHLLQLVEDEGAAGISRLAGLDAGNGNDKDNDELVHAFPSNGDEGTNQFKYKMMAKDDTPMLQRKIIREKKTLDHKLPLTDLTAEGLHKALKQMSSDGSNHQVVPSEELP